MTNSAFAIQPPMPAKPSGAVPIPAERQQAIAQYIADMVLELRNLAKSARLNRVLVPLEFAYYEAFGEANKVSVPEAERERLQKLARTAAEAEGHEPPAA